MDFVLWKPSSDDLPGWDSPWGRGRPGWHIECSAMSHELLGDSFDIHGGGIDLQFPHHENEIAQSMCAHPEASFAKVWMHNEMLQVEGKKMSKSLGNFFTVRDLLDRGVPGEVIRFVFLQTHYSKPMDWTEEKAKQAEATLRKWRAITAGHKPADLPAKEVTDAISDDLNTAEALTLLHALGAEGRAGQLLASARLLGLLTSELGGWETPKENEEYRAALQAVISRWIEARGAKDFGVADEIRKRMLELGYQLSATPSGANVSIDTFSMLQHVPTSFSSTAQVLLFEQGQPGMAAAQYALIPKLASILEALK